MMAQLIAAAKCAPSDSVYGGGDVATGCLPSTGLPVVPVVLFAVALVMIGVGLRLWTGDDPAYERALADARRGQL